MTLLLIKILRKFVKLIVDHADPKHVALGISVGMLLGLAPTNIVYLFFIIACVCIVNMNISAVFFGFLIFSLLSMLTDPIAHSIGVYLLITQKWLLPLWTTLYNVPILPWLNFNNTLMLGNMILGLVLLIPVYLGSIKGIQFFRHKLKDKLANSKFMKTLKATPFVKWFFRIQEILR